MTNWKASDWDGESTDNKEAALHQARQDYIDSWIEGDPMTCHEALEALITDSQGEHAELLDCYRTGDDAELVSAAGRLCRKLEKILEEEVS